MYPYQSGGSIVKQQILDVIKSAKFTIDVCVYNNSDADIVSALKLARNKGLRVRYITDKSTSNPALKKFKLSDSIPWL
jgi:phosphatidylserine/phosphatidylglycerophosphate/cardiolipin synthase-like enzyme